MVMGGVVVENGMDVKYSASCTIMWKEYLGYLACNSGQDQCRSESMQ